MCLLAAKKASKSVCLSGYCLRFSKVPPLNLFSVSQSIKVYRMGFCVSPGIHYGISVNAAKMFRLVLVCGKQWHKTSSNFLQEENSTKLTRNRKCNLCIPSSKSFKLVWSHLTLKSSKKIGIV